MKLGYNHELWNNRILSAYPQNANFSLIYQLQCTIFSSLKRQAAFLQTPPRQILTVAASFIVFIAAFVLLYPLFGVPIAILGFLPILIGAWIYGMWAGLLFTVALYAIVVLILVFLNGGNIPIVILPGELLGLATAMAASLIVGRLGQLGRRKQENYLRSTALLEEAHQRVNELSGLQNISRAFTLNGDARQTYGQLTETLAGLIGAKICIIYLYNPATHDLLPQPSAYGLQDKTLAVLHYTPDLDMAAWDFSKSGIFRAHFSADPARVYSICKAFAGKLHAGCARVEPPAKSFGCNSGSK